MRLIANGTDVEIDERHETTPLLWVLRDALGLPGTKFGCGAGFCAACTVLIDGRNEKSCRIAPGRTGGQQVTTVEGVSGVGADAVRGEAGDRVHPYIRTRDDGNIVVFSSQV